MIRSKHQNRNLFHTKQQQQTTHRLIIVDTFIGAYKMRTQTQLARISLINTNIENHTSNLGFKIKWQAIVCSPDGPEMLYSIS